MGTVHFVSIGEVLNDRYEIIKELGSGQYSTVWLARDRSRHGSYSAIKILREESGQNDTFELEILKRLSEGNPDHTGYQHITCLLDHFIYSRHLCLVLEPTAESLKDFCLFFEAAKIPPVILKRITKQLLAALDYAHSLGIIHTDIKQDNIMMKIRNESVIEEHLQNPDDSLGELNFENRDAMSEVQVVLGDWGTASWESRHLSENIQPVLLRAPEVLLQAPWGKEVDIWNLGALLPELLDTVRMYSGRAIVTGGDYQIKHHIEEIDALFGPFPSHLLKEGNPEVIQRLFNEDLQIRDPIECPPAILDRWIECLDGEEKQNFLLLLRAMMVIDPKNRMTAQSLQNELWLTS
ncbi:serine-threonine protein kinase [Penicillium verhagenii]|uniref:serine-threonine protein kinase n=1 Tax=Penicillium verhagenii TaxID=1562060 RepID=UPI002545B502|nr:serine-threonine protein kinase [Penicillium verhagenii]KAJ5928076.1 serine-threonine protein kinase [Penicillium verhagenii]